MCKYQTADPKTYRYLVELQKQLKANMTDAEKLLWEHLRGKKTGVKFRRQHIIDIFIVDFVCLKKWLIIEVDGEIHNFQKELDTERENILIGFGFKVLRFTNDEVFNNTQEVINLILAEIDCSKN